MGACLISVCMPSYNQELYIQQSVESVLNQSFEDFELIICDDCSSDRTLDIVSSFRDDRVKVYSNKYNLGLAANWNKSISLASGQYVKLLCGDDLIYKDCLKLQLSALRDSKNITLVTSSRDIIGPNSKKLFTITPRLEKHASGHLAVSRTLKAGTNIFGEPGSVMFKKDDITSLKFNDDFPYVIDVDMWIQLLLKGNLCVLKQPLSAFRLSKTHLSSRVVLTQSRDFSSLIDKYAKEVALSNNDMRIGKICSKINMLARYLVHSFCCNLSYRPFHG